MSGTSSPSSVLSQRVRPSMRTGSDGSVCARAAARSAPTSIVGHDAGRSRRCRAMRSSSSGSPGHAVPRNHARPSPASRRVAASPNRLLPLRVPPRAKISGLATATPPAHERHGAITARHTSVAVKRDLDGRAQAVSIEPAAPPTMDAVATRPTAAPIIAAGPSAHAVQRPPGPDRATATVTAPTIASRPETASLNQAPRPSCPTRSRSSTTAEHRQPARHRTAHDDDRPGHEGPHDAVTRWRVRRPRRPGRSGARPPRQVRRPDPPERVPRRRRRARRRASAVSARPSRCRPPDTAASTPTAAIAPSTGSAGQGQDHERSRRRRPRPPPRPGRRPRHPGRPRRRRRAAGSTARPQLGPW